VLGRPADLAQPDDLRSIPLDGRLADAQQRALADRRLRSALAAEKCRRLAAGILERGLGL
jgi:hypothetical protein